MTSLPRIPAGLALTYGIDLLYTEKPQIVSTELIAVLRPRMSVELLGDSPAGIDLAHRDHRVAMKGGDVPSITKVIRSQRPFEPSDYVVALRQTWDWPGAQAALSRSQHQLRITDVIGSGLNYRERFRLVTGVAEEVAALTQPEACFWAAAGCFVNPKDLRPRFAQACNVRFFEDRSDGSKLMDTLGLAALGVPDAQFQFKDLEPSRVAGWMYGVGKYLFDEDDVIQDGDTIPGLEVGDRWTCRHQDAIVPPARVVIDIALGPVAASGDTKRLGEPDRR